MYKSAISILTAAMLMAGVVSCNTQQSEEQVKATTTSLMSINKGMDSVFNQLKQSYETFQPIEMDRALEGMIVYIEKAADSLRSMKIEGECKELSDALIEKAGTMRKIASSEAREQVRIYKIPDSDFTDELRTQWDAISTNVDKKMADANAKISAAINVINQKRQKSAK